MYKIQAFLRNGTILHDFQNALILQPLDEFLCPTPKMKARDAYVPILLFKSLNKNKIWELSGD